MNMIPHNLRHSETGIRRMATPHPIHPPIINEERKSGVVGDDKVEINRRREGRSPNSNKVILIRIRRKERE
jgi:hypothetical protein